MESKKIYIEETPAILWGPDLDKVYLYVHGQGGNKNEAGEFASIATGYGYQVVSVDLPEHGERRKGSPPFAPWHTVPELRRVMAWCKRRWTKISLFANSIGAGFSMLAFAEEGPRACLFVSPVVDMENLISNMMRWANVSLSRLEQEKEIPTDFGQTLSWRYWQYARAHPIQTWNVPTQILYGEKDHLTDRPTLERFSSRFPCEVTVMKNGEHWFHTEAQLEVLYDWVRQWFEQNSKAAATAPFG